MKFYAIFRVLGGPKAGLVDFLDIIQSASLSDAEAHADATYDHSDADWFDIEEFDTLEAAIAGQEITEETLASHEH